MIILGINSFFEHPAVALLKDGKLLFAIEDERLTRVKHGKSYTPYKTFVPFDSIYAALKETGIHASQIDEVAYSYSSELHSQALMRYAHGTRKSPQAEEEAALCSLKNFREALNGKYELPKRYSDFLPENGLANAAYREWDHHLSHAASAFFFSGLNDALIIVSDGSGEISATSIYVGKGAEINKVASVDLPDSLGFFYSDFTQFLGFEPFSDEYKVMGLGAYGSDAYRESLDKILKQDDDGRYVYDTAELEALKTRIGARSYGSALTEKDFDLACSVQRKLERVLISLISHYMEKTGLKNVCLAGGTFLNVLANSRIAEIDGIGEVFIQPASHDAGTALGAAALSHVHAGGQPQIEYESMFLGSEYDSESIEKALELSSLAYEKIPAERMTAKIAEVLHEEKIVGLFRGRMEFGPRALGNRSIIASPRSAKTREHLNILKDREMFRPLAPIVTHEEFDTFFVGTRNRYMMFTCNATKRAVDLIPAVVHADQTCRVQTINKADDEFLHQILSKFKEKSGVAVLINTSMNVRGKPIDLTPQDALNSFFTSGIDCLVLNDYFIHNPMKRSGK